MEIVFIQVFFFTIGSKQKKKKNTEYHGTFIPFKSQLYSKNQGVPFFSYLGHGV